MGVLRILLALSVVAIHSKPMFGSRLVGDVAVNTFFIISGFYMTLILHGKYSGSNLKLFFTNRALRLYPTYFAILAFVVLSEALRWYWRGVPSGVMDRWVHSFAHLNVTTLLCLAVTNITFFGADVLFFLGISPSGGLHSQSPQAPTSALDLQVVRQTWSLGSEVVFYCLAPWLTRLPLKFLLGFCLACLAVRFAFLHDLSSAPDTWWQTFFLCRLPLFLLGSIAFHWNRLAYSRRWITQRSGVLAVVFMLALSIAYGPLTMMPALYYFSIVGLTPFLFHFSNTFHWDRLIGDFSYSMYLLHWVVLQYTWQVINRVPEWSFSFLSALVAMAGSAVIWWAIEKPIDRFRQRRITTAP